MNPHLSYFALQCITFLQLSLLLVVFFHRNKFFSCNDTVLHFISEFAQLLIFLVLSVANVFVCFVFNVLIILDASFSSFIAFLLLYL